MDLSPHFTLEEMTFSQTAVRHNYNNIPNEAGINNLKALCENVLEPLRAAVNKPIRISSGYRSIIVNAAIGGVKTSQHCKGEAVDLTIAGMTNLEIIAAVKSLNLPVDQCIEEFGSWVHLSHKSIGTNRNEYLKATRQNGRAVYSPL